MLSPLSPSAQRFLSDLARLEARTGKTQQQVSSGLRIESPSDEPDLVPDLLRLHASLDQAVQAREDFGSVKLLVDTGEQSLESATTLLDRAVQIAAQAAGSSAGAGQKQVLAVETEGLIERLRALAGATAAGEAVFGDEAREITDVDGFRFPVSQTADDVFKTTLEALESLRASLPDGDVEAVQAALHTAQQQMSEHLAFYGRAQNTLKQALDTAAKRETSGRAALAGMREADTAAAAIELTEARNQRDAALASRASLPRTSLLDYLG